MAFPDVRVEIQVGSAWTDITGDVLRRDRLTVRRGRSDGGTQADPSSCTLTLANDGRYSPRNPLSPYYGLIGRNTPLRWSVPYATRLVLDGTAGGQATTPSQPAFTSADLDLRAEADAVWGSGLGQALISKWGAAGQRSYGLWVARGNAALTWSTTGTDQRFVLASLPAGVRGRLALRATLDVNNGAGGHTVVLYWARSLAGPWVPLGTTVGAGTTTIFAGTAPLQIGGEDTTISPAVLPADGDVYRAEVRTGIDGALVASPDFTTLAPGSTGFTDSAGVPWTLEGTAAVSDRLVRFHGEVSAWPPRWDLSGQDVSVPVQAAGLLRRLGQGAKALESTLRRRIPADPDVIAYWPMEEERGADQAYSPLPRVQAAATSAMEWAADESLGGSAALPRITTASRLTGRVPSATAGRWHVECVYKLDAAPPEPCRLLEIRTTGTYDRLLVSVEGGNVKLLGLVSSDTGTTITTVLNVIAIDFYSRWNRLLIRAEQSGGSTTFHVNWVTIGLVERGLSTTVTATAGRVTQVMIAPSVQLGDRQLHMGHLAVFRVVRSRAFDQADDGFAGTSALDWLTRLPAEEGIPITVAGVPAEAPSMGPQLPATLLELLRQAENADGGLLGERRDRLALAYRARASLYSQPPALRLDYTARHEVAPPLTPVEDDDATRNDITVQRAGGSSARAVQESGPLSVAPPPAGVGRYDEAVTLNLYADEQTEPAAYWRLWLGTQDELRWPSVTVNLAAAPHLIPTATTVAEGDRITIANLPPWLPPGAADLLVLGYTEVVDLYRWEITFTCAPARPWAVGQVAVYEDFESATPAIPLTAGGALPWTRTTTTPHTGAWCLRSGAIGNNQTSDAVLTVPPGASELTFWYRVSSEAAGPGFLGDRFQVIRDGALVFQVQGTAGTWARSILDVSTASSITFRYTKDNSSAAGEDAAYIDNLALVYGAAPDRADTDGSQLAAAVTATATTLSVATTSGPLWTTAPAELPVTIAVGGEEMTVLAISGASSPQSFTVIRSANGISKAHAAGADVRLARPTITAL
ncbi:hypothetical protein [Streptomyces youssoufiensis]